MRVVCGGMGTACGGMRAAWLQKALFALGFDNPFNLLARYFLHCHGNINDKIRAA